MSPWETTMGSELAPADDWGALDIGRDTAWTFAQHLRLDERDARSVAETLEYFPHQCQVRGMFFDGLVNVIKSEYSATTANELMRETGVKGRMIPFAFLPHRDFYKLYFAAAARLHPNRPLGDGLEAIAKTFYPVFRSSMVGRTLGVMIGKDPRKVLERLVDAYNLSVQDNEHAVRPVGTRSMIWECRVEPSPFYNRTFAGIVAGTMDSHGVRAPRIEQISRIADGRNNVRWVFGIKW